MTEVNVSFGLHSGSSRLIVNPQNGTSGFRWDISHRPASGTHLRQELINGMVEFVRRF
jgi:hypothetical protein